MKKAKFSSLTLKIAAVIAGVLTFATTAQAASSTWTAPASGAWATASDWAGSVIPGATGTTNNSDTATFNNTATSYAITVDSGRNIGSITFAASGSAAAGGYQFSPAVGGPLILSAGGSITVASGDGSGAYFYSTLPIQLAGSYSFTDNTVNTIGVNQASNPGGGKIGYLAMGGVNQSNGANSSTNYLTGVANTGAITLTLNGTGHQYGVGQYGVMNVGANDWIGGQIANGTGNTLSIVKSGAGTWLVIDNGTQTTSALNSFTGSVTIDGGILGIMQVANGGTNSDLGASSNAAGNLVFNGGTLLIMPDNQSSSGDLYIPSKSTDRLFTIGDASSAANTATIDSSLTVGNLNSATTNIQGSSSHPLQSGLAAILPNNSTDGTVTFSNTGAIVYGGSSGNHGLTLQGQNQGNNILSLGIQDGGGGITSLTKSGVGTWILNGTNNGYSGNTTINGGVLRDANATGNGVSSNSLVVINNGTYESDANITRTLGAAAGNVEILGGQSGFSANGAPVTVNLSSGAALKFGTGTFNPSQFILNAPTANNALTLTNGLDLNGANQTIATYANTATINGVISNSAAVTSVVPALYKIGGGTLVLNNTNTYAGGTQISGGVVSGTASGAFGTGNVTASNGAEVRIAALNDIAAGKKVTLNNGTLGLGYNAPQADITGLLASGATGIIALDGAQGNALDMSVISNTGMFLGSSTSGTYSAATLGGYKGGTENGTPVASVAFGNAYNLGGGGGTLTLTSSVLNDNTPIYLGTNPANALRTTAYSDSAVYAATSNTRTRLVVGDGSNAGNRDTQGNLIASTGTVDLRAVQGYSNSTTVNAGATLQLDYSTGTAGTGNIISSSSPVTLTGGTLAALANSSAVDAQTLGGVTTTLGASTINVNSNGATGGNGVTLNLGTINAALPAGVANYTTVGTGTTLLFNQTGANANAVITTTTAPNGGESTAQKTIGLGQYVYNNNGTYGWAASSSAGPTYTVSNLLQANETAAPIGSSVGSKPNTNYYYDASAGSGGQNAFFGGDAATFGNTINLMRVNNNSGNWLGLLGGGSSNTTFLNGLLTTGNSPTSFGTRVGAISSKSGNLYIQNYGTGSLEMVAPITGSTNVIYGGTGVVLVDSASYTGTTYLNGATVQSYRLTGFPAAGNLVINSGAIALTGVTGTNNLDTNAQWNGNFTLLEADSTQDSLIGNAFANPAAFKNVTLTNNITTTLDTGGRGNWSIIGTLADGGYGYGLTIAGPNQYLSNFYFGSSAVQTTPQNSFMILNGTTTSTGPITVLGAGLDVQSGTATNRNNVLYLGANTNTIFTTNVNLAGLADAGAPGGASEFLAGQANSGSLTISLWGSGNYSFGGNINSNYIGASGSEGFALNMNGTGTQTLTGSNNFGNPRFAMTLNAGTLFIDASQGGGAWINNQSNGITLAGGTLKFKGDPTTFDIHNTSITPSAGGSAIVVDNNGSTPGNTTLNLGGIAAISVGATLNFDAIGSAAPKITELSANNSHSYLGTFGKVTYTSTAGVTTWAAATTSGSTNTIGAYTGDSATLPQSGSGAGTTYSLTGNQTQTNSATVDTLRINNGGTAGTLGLAGNTLRANGVLFNGSSNYAIGSSAGDGFLNSTATSLADLTIQNFGTNGAALTINSVINNQAAGATATALTISGPGTTVLTATNTYGGVTYLNNGTINFNRLSNFGTGTGANGITFNGGTLQYATGNTTDLTAAAGQKTITVNDSGATIDTNGNTVTYANAFGTGQGGVTFVDTASVHGTLNINNSTGYTGVTTIGNGGNVNLGNNGNLNAGSAFSSSQTADSGTVIASGGTLSGGTTQATNTTQGTATAGTGNNNAGRITLQSGGVLKPGDFTAGVTLPNGAGDGNFFGNQPSGAAHNVMNAQGLTWNAGGTLSFQLNSASQQGSATNPSASTTLNLGTGAFVKSGTGLFVLNFNNTGNYNTTGASFNGNNGDFTNVYDLVNFGATSLTGGTNGNTNFNIDDFSIQNLNGIGTLSFYYNPYADGGIGQEELLLTVVPEPSTWAMLLGGLVALVFWTRKRSRKTSFAKAK